MCCYLEKVIVIDSYKQTDNSEKLTYRNTNEFSAIG